MPLPCIPCIGPIIGASIAGVATLKYKGSGGGSLIYAIKEQNKKQKEERDKDPNKKKTIKKKKAKKKKRSIGPPAHRRSQKGGRKRIGNKRDSVRLQKKVQNRYRKCKKSCKSKYCRSKCLKEFHKDWSNKDKYLRSQSRRKKYTSSV